MKATEITENWKTLKSFIINRVTGVDTEKLTNDFYQSVDNGGYEVMKEIGIDEFMPLYKKIVNLNILDKRVDFKIFDNLPKIWNVIYNASIDISASEKAQ